MTLRELEQRISILKSTLPDIPTYSEFTEQWASMDGLSRSLFECAAGCPEIIDSDDIYWQTISKYIQQMGITVEPVSLKMLAKELASDK